MGIHLKSSFEVKSICDSILFHISRNKKQFVKRYNRHPDRYPFNPKMVELMAGSKVFIYPELLPKLACFEVESGMCKAYVLKQKDLDIDKFIELAYNSVDGKFTFLTNRTVSTFYLRGAIDCYGNGTIYSVLQRNAER